MSSATTTSSRASRTIVECGCGARAKLCTSWTAANPGRRFYGCPYYKSKRNAGCGFFDWYDVEVSAREKRIIKSLLHRIDKHQEKEKKFWVALILSWVFSVVCVLFMVLVLKNFKGEGVMKKLFLA